MIAPTTYYSTPVEVFEQAGIAVVIWANQNVRSSIAAMQATTRRIFAERSIQNVEDGIVPIKEVFRLQNAEELLLAEELYLPRRRAPTRAIILAASRGKELGEITASIPKAMVSVGGRPLLHKLVAQFRAAGVRAITVVRGYAGEKVHAPEVEFVENEDFEGTGELPSLNKARDRIDGVTIISFGDILFRQHILNSLLAEENDIIVAVDAMWKRPRERGTNGYVDYVTATRSYSLRYDEEDAFLAKMGPDLSPEKIHGEWIGLIKTTARGSAAVCDALDVLSKRLDFRRLRFDDLFNHLVSQGQQVQVLYITGQWLDVDDLEDLARAQAF
jgi:phosphoenolpyruvate phosphomutase